MIRATVKGGRLEVDVPVPAELVAGIEHSSSRDRNMKCPATVTSWPFQD